MAMDVQALACQEHQYDDPYFLVLKDKVQYADARDVTIGDDGVLRMQVQICAANVDGLRELILEEAHSSWYSIHPGAVKMYQDLRQHYWWRRMKKDIVGFVARCLKCLLVKYGNERPDRGTQFTSQFWRAIQHELGTLMELSKIFHPQTDG
ncbi:uncharacterized protein [Nicotiana sylvestris]|uniref:uncharacterized protein n=1 Tax=Nicotiana sylvestris TaxID=4096 RepID=UPI00388CD8E2